MLELLLIGALISIAALAIRRYHLRAQVHATLPVSLDRRVEPMDGTDRLLERRAGLGSNPGQGWVDGVGWTDQIGF